mmetsp:Transcript_18870/g.47852  ORF Transcript_18870/g.47852 Transcript_18870/m.47852 type:complete len:251 (+) Transcript_18870:211-963(+)
MLCFLTVLASLTCLLFLDSPCRYQARLAHKRVHTCTTAQSHHTHLMAHPLMPLGSVGSKAPAHNRAKLWQAGHLNHRAAPPSKSCGCAPLISSFGCHAILIPSQRSRQRVTGAAAAASARRPAHAPPAPMLSAQPQAQSHEGGAPAAGTRTVGTAAPCHQARPWAIPAAALPAPCGPPRLASSCRTRARPPPSPAAAPQTRRCLISWSSGWWPAARAPCTAPCPRACCHWCTQRSRPAARAPAQSPTAWP